MGGDANGEWRYINVRRLFLFLRESIDEGTQWVVFEPNTPDLWAKITRNITAFLTNVWRAGALFGTTPQEAFYVKCDAETNPPAISKSLRVGLVRFRQVFDSRETQIPSLVQIRCLRMSPQRIHRRPNENLDVYAHRRSRSARIARVIAAAESRRKRA